MTCLSIHPSNDTNINPIIILIRSFPGKALTQKRKAASDLEREVARYVSTCKYMCVCRYVAR